MRRITLIAAIVLASTAAWAGVKQPAPVIIEIGDGFGSASGDMLTAANDENPDAFIGCGTRNFDNGAGGTFIVAFCQAQLVADEAVTCFTENRDLVESIRAISDFSFITFSWTDDGEGELTCQSIGVSTQSFYIDKVQKSKGK